MEALESRELLFTPPPAPILVVNNQFTVTDTDGDLVTVKLTGPGTLEAFDTNGIARISRMYMSSTTTASTLNISVTKKPGGDGFVTVAHIGSDGDLNLLNGSKADVSEGLLEFAGRVNEIKLRDLFGSGLTMGGDLTKSTKFTARRLQGVSLNFGSRLVTSLRVNGADEALIGAGAIGSWISSRINGVSGTGDLDTLHMELLGVPGVTKALNSMAFAGVMTDGVIQVTGQVGSITGAAIVTTSLAVTGGLQTLKTTLGQMTGAFSAGFFKTIDAKGLLQAEIAAQGADGSGVSFGSIKADEVNANISVQAKFVTGARIGAFAANIVSHLSMGGGSIGSFKVKTNALDVDIQVRDDVRVQQVDTFSVGGRFGGSLVVRGSAGNLTFGAIDDAVVLVGVVHGQDDPDDFRDLGLPSDATGLYSAAPAGTIKSLTFPKPKASSGFNSGNPNLGKYWIVARQIDKFSSFGTFAEDFVGDTIYGLGVQFIKSFSLTISDGTFKTSNLDALKLDNLAVSDPTLIVSSNPSRTETGLVHPNLTGDARLRLYR